MPGWHRSRQSTIPPILERNASARPDKVGFWCDGEPVTNAGLESRTTAWANGLHELGVRPGDRVAVYLDNCPEIVYSWFACAKLGAIHVPINTALAGAFLQHQLRTAEPCALVTTPALAERLGPVAAELDGLRHIVVRGDEPDVAVARQFLEPRLATLPTAQLSAALNDRLVHPADVRWDDLNAILFTSGTTGPSKGAAMTQNYLVEIARSITDAVGFDEDSVWYQPSPLFHVNASINAVLGPAVAGGTGATDPKFSASNYWNRTRHYGATHVSLLTFAVMLWKQPERDDDADNPVRVAAGSAVPGDLHELIEKRFDLKILKFYGLSEACVTPLMSTLEHPSPPGYSGRPSPLFDVALFDEHDEEVATGQPGEIVFRPRAPHIMFAGYWNNPQATVDAWRNGWFHTGDLGTANEEGWVAFVDRRKDYIRRRGENISSYELEGVLTQHPAVAACAVHGVPAAVGEEDVKACLVLEPGVTLDLEAFAAFCTEQLPRFAVPRYVEILDDLPRNPTGRVLKAELRARGITADTWDRTPEDQTPEGRPA